MPETRIRASLPAARRAGRPQSRQDVLRKCSQQVQLPQPGALSNYAVANGLTAEQVVAQAQAKGVAAQTRRLAQQTQAENVAAATAVYDSCFGPGSFAADTQKRN